MDRLVRISTSVQKKKRDDYGRAVARGLRARGFFQHVPMHMVRGYGSLFSLAADVRRKLKEQGLVGPDGLPSGFISEYRQLMLAQAKFLQTMLEVADSVTGGRREIDISEQEADEIIRAAIKPEVAPENPSAGGSVAATAIPDGEVAGDSRSPDEEDPAG
jgi:hypothetical protein